ARLLTGGFRYEKAGPGFFFAPTVFVDADNSMRLCQEEIFGPVAAVMPLDTGAEAGRVADATVYRLAAGVWTTDLGRAHRMAAALDAGTVWVNTYRSMSPMSPREGFGSSGLGVEQGTEVVREYTRLKSVWVDTGDGGGRDPFVLRS